MKQFLRCFLISFVALFGSLNVWAYDFAVENEDGVLIYYNVISLPDLTCEVAFGDESYVGDVIEIPQYVSFANKNFSVVAIGNNAFKGSNINSVLIPEGVTTIKNYVFSYSELTKIDFPSSLTFIGIGAFERCYNLTELYLPDNITYIGQLSFTGCKNIEKITLSKNLTMGMEAFYECAGLKELIIPNGLNEIGPGAFNGCASLNKLVLPYSISKISSNSFRNCISLKEIIVYNTIPPSCYSSETFNNVSKVECVIKVPKSAIEDYRNAKVWNEFWNIEGIDGSTLENEIYNLNDLEEYSRLWSDEYNSITYTRNFKNTDLQPLYVPFSMSYDDWADDFDVFRINGFYEYDRDGDGFVDNQALEVIKVTVENGALKPNHPYLIRAKSEGVKSITLENSTLYAADINSIDCSTVDSKYIFTGTYSRMSGLQSAGYYSMKSGKLCQAESDDVELGAFRWYLQIVDRSEQFQSRPAKIMVRVLDDDDATGIDELKMAGGNEQRVYSVDGRVVDGGRLSRGLYIRNGKKFIVR